MAGSGLNIGGGGGGTTVGVGMVSGVGGSNTNASTSPNTSTTEDKLVGALMNRLIAKLPLTTGRRLSELEKDAGYIQCLGAIEELAKKKTNLVVNALLGLLDRYVPLDEGPSRMTTTVTESDPNSTSNSNPSWASSPPPIYVHETSILLLKCISCSLNSYWRHQTILSGHPVYSSAPQQQQQQQQSLRSTPPEPWPTPTTIPDFPTERLMKAASNFLKLFTTETGSVRGRTRLGPPGESLVRRVHIPIGEETYDVGLRYRAFPVDEEVELFQSEIGLGNGAGAASSRLKKDNRPAGLRPSFESREQPERESASPNRGHSGGQTFLSSRQSMASHHKPQAQHYPHYQQKQQQQQPPQIQTTHQSHDRTHSGQSSVRPNPSNPKAPHSNADSPIDDFILDHYVRQVGRIIFAVSTFQWDEVWNGIQGELRAEMGSGVGDDRERDRERERERERERTDPLNVFLLEYCNLDRQRLGTVIKEYSASWIHLHRSSQSTLSKALWTAIWSWIESHQSEFIELVRLESEIPSASQLFDAVTNMAGESKRPNTMCALRTMLLVTCPAYFRTAFWEAGGDGSNNKKIIFLDNIRKTLAGTRIDQLASESCVDIFRAASFLPPDLHDSGIMHFALDVLPEIRPVLAAEIETEQHSAFLMLTETAVSAKRMQIAQPSLLLPIIDDRSLRVQIHGISAMILLCTEADRMIHLHVNIASMDVDSARMIRQYLVETLGAIVAFDWSDGVDHSFYPEMAQRLHLFNLICTLYTLQPNFAFIGAVRCPVTQNPQAGKPHPDGLFDEAPRSEACDDGVVQLLLRLSIAIEDNNLELSLRVKSAKLLLALERHIVKLDFGSADNIALKRSLYFTSPNIAGSLYPALVRLLQNTRIHSTLVAIVVEQIYLMETIFSSMDQASGLPESVEQMILSRQAADVALICCLVVVDADPMLAFVSSNVELLTKNWSGQIETSWDLHRAQLYRDLTLVETKTGMSLKRKQVRAACRNSLRNPSRVAKTVWLLENELLVTLYNRLSNNSSGVGDDKKLVTVIQSVAWYLSACSGSLEASTVLHSYKCTQDSDSQKTAGRLTDDLVDLLVADSLDLREAAKVALGVVPSGMISPLLFRLQSILNHTFHEDGIDIDDVFNTFADYASGTIRVLAERHEEEAVFDFSSASRLASTATLLGRYIERLPEGTLAVRCRHNLALSLAGLGRLIACSIPEVSELVFLLQRWLATSLERDAGTLQVTVLEAIAALTSQRPKFLRSMQTADVVRYINMYLACLDKDTLETPRKIDLVHNILSQYAMTFPSQTLPIFMSVAIDSIPRTKLLILRILQTTLVNGGLSDTDPTTEELAMHTPLRAAVANNLRLALALCSTSPVTESETIIFTVYRIWREAGTLAENIKELLKEEVARTDTQTQLFRTNSSATRMMILVTRNAGYNYFRELLKPFFQALHETGLDQDADGNFGEEDPDNEAKKAIWLKSICCVLIKTILHSGDLPDQLRSWYEIVYEVTISRFPAAGSVGVASFFFLRLLCPSIINPERFDISVPVNFRKSLVIVSKTLINIASKQLFPVKDMQNDILNEVINRYTPLVTDHMEQIGSKRGAAQDLAIVTSSTVSEVELAAEEKYLLWIVRKPDVHNALPVNVLSDILPLLTRMGSPEPQNRAARFTQFLESRQTVDTSAYQSVFFEGSPSLGDPSRTFYLNYKSISDGSHLALHILRMLNNIDVDFNVIINVAGNGLESDTLPLSLIQTLADHLPAETINRARIALFQPGYETANTIRACQAFFHVAYEETLRPYVTAVSSPSQLAKTIPFQALELGVADVKYSESPAEVLQSLKLLVDQREIPVNAYLQHEGQNKSLILRSQDRIELWPGMLASELTAKFEEEHVSDELLNRLRGKDVDRIRTFFKRNNGFVNGASKSASEERLQASLFAAGLMHSQDVWNEDIRSKGIELLASLNSYLDLPVPKKYFCPPDSDNLLEYVKFGVTLSSRLAGSVRGLQLQVANEMMRAVLPFAQGQQRAACVKILLPWMSALRDEALDAGAEEAMIKSLVHALLNLSASNTELWPSWLDPIWSYLSSSIADVNQLLLDEILQSLATSDFPMARAQAISIWEHPGLTAKLSSQLRKTIANSFVTPSRTLGESPSFTKISSLCHLLAVIINRSSQLKTDLGCTEVALAMPDIVYAVAMLAGAGNHDLQVSLAKIVSGVGRALSSDTRGLQNAVTKLSSNGGLLDMASMRHTKTLIEALTVLMVSNAPTKEMRNTWMTRLSGLVASTCFQYNPPIQIRAVLFLGTLISDDAGEVEDDLMYQLASAVYLALQRNEPSDHLLHALLSTLRVATKCLGDDSRYTGGTTFWWGIRLLEADRPVLYNAAIDFLHAGLERNRAVLREPSDLLRCLLEERRQGDYEHLDESFGLNFNDAALASFSIMTLVMRAWKQSELQDRGVQVARYFFEGTHREGQSVSGPAIPFFAYLYLNGDSTVIDGARPRRSPALMDSIVIESESTALLLAALLAQFLQNSNSDNRTLSILSAMADLSKISALTMASMQEIWSPSILSIITHTNRDDLLCLAVLMVADMETDRTSNENSGVKRIHKLGMWGMLPPSLKPNDNQRPSNLMEMASLAFNV